MKLSILQFDERYRSYVVFGMSHKIEMSYKCMAALRQVGLRAPDRVMPILIRGERATTTRVGILGFRVVSCERSQS